MEMYYNNIVCTSEMSINTFITSIIYCLVVFIYDFKPKFRKYILYILYTLNINNIDY